MMHFIVDLVFVIGQLLALAHMHTGKGGGGFIEPYKAAIPATHQESREETNVKGAC
jgi:hypothetical protein